MPGILGKKPSKAFQNSKFIKHFERPDVSFPIPPASPKFQWIAWEVEFHHKIDMTAKKVWKDTDN